MSKKATIVKQSLTDDSLTSLFQQLLGSDKPSPDIIKPKYATIVSSINLVVRILQSFNDDVFMTTYPEMKSQSDGITSFVSKLLELRLTLDINNDSGDAIVDAYLSVKNSEEIAQLLETCKNLIQNKTSLESTEVDVGFVDRLPGLTFYPFAFSSINLKELWANRSTTIQIKKYIVTVCKVMYKKTHKIYETVTSADIDVNQFSELIITSIAKVKKLIPRCDQAFDKIEKSVSLLKNNFNGYYKDFIQTQNPACIMQNFVTDVATQDDVDAKTTFQFRKIISFYQQKTQGKITDPRIKKVFELLGDNMKILENDNIAEIKKMEAEELLNRDNEKKMEEVQLAQAAEKKAEQKRTANRKKNAKRKEKKNGLNAGQVESKDSDVDLFDQSERSEDTIATIATNQSERSEDTIATIATEVAESNETKHYVSEEDEQLETVMSIESNAYIAIDRSDV